jgi:hypothetical protein
MGKKEIRLSVFVIGLFLIGLTACRNIKGEEEKIITSTPQITPVVDQEDSNMITTVTPEITKTVDNTDTTENLKEPISPTYIPESLLAFIENSIKKGDEFNTFSAIVSDKELSSDDIISFSKDKVIGEYVDMVEASTGKVLQVDADNDGVQDLYFWINDGGSMGNSSRYLLKGNADGTYMMTDTSFIEITQELAFINFEGKNYLLQTTYDYNTKINNGFEIICFIDGTVHERVFLNKDAVDYKGNINLIDKSLESVAKNCEKIGLDQYAYHVRYNDYKIQGSAERLLQESEYKDYVDDNSYSLNSDVYYGADIDNDGKEEIYNKDIFFTSTSGMITHLQYKICNMKDKDIIKKCLNKISYPQMFWIEQSEVGNIVCILYLDNLLDYSICGYNITKDQVKEVFRVVFTGNMIIDRAIYTTGINLENEKW